MKRCNFNLIYNERIYDGFDEKAVRCSNCNNASQVLIRLDSLAFCKGCLTDMIACIDEGILSR